MLNNKFFDDLETRSIDERNDDHLEKLNKLVKIAKNNTEMWPFPHFLKSTDPAASGKPVCGSLANLAPMWSADILR